MQKRESVAPYGGILADNVGAGKTFTIAGLLRESPLWPVLILVPKSLIWQWMDVLNDADLEEELHVVPSARRNKTKEKNKDAIVVGIGMEGNKLILATHGCLLDPPEEMLNRSWGRIVVDEAHCAKNPKSITNRSLLALRAHAKWGLTATPVQNCKDDLSAIARALGIVSDDPKFIREMFVHQTTPLEEPDRTSDKRLSVTTMSIPLQKEMEVKAYRDAVKLLARVGISLDAKEDEEEDGQEQEQEFDLFPEWANTNTNPNTNMCRMAFLRCRQAATHPSLYYESMSASLASASASESHTRCIEFRIMAEQARTIPAIEASSKIEFIVNDVLSHPDQAAVVFCEWSSEMRLIVDALRSAGAEALSYNGKLSVQEREDVLSRFRKWSQKANQPTVLVAQIKCASAGLNLQCACRGYIMRPQWNPATERQAIGRLHRSGQERDVHVIRLVASIPSDGEGAKTKTVDELALGKQQIKLKCITEVMKDGEMEKTLGGLATVQLQDLI